MEMTPKYSPILWWPQSNIPKRIFIFLTPPPPPPQTNKKIEIQNFEPKKKIAQAYLCMKISEYPSPLGFGCLTLFKIEVIEYGKKGFKLASNAFSET